MVKNINKDNSFTSLKLFKQAPNNIKFFNIFRIIDNIESKTKTLCRELCYCFAIDF